MLLHVITRRLTETANIHTLTISPMTVKSLDPDSDPSIVLERVLIGCHCSALFSTEFSENIRKRDCASNSAGTWVLFSRLPWLSRPAFSECLPTRTQRSYTHSLKIFIYWTTLAHRVTEDVFFFLGE